MVSKREKMDMKANEIRAVMEWEHKWMNVKVMKNWNSFTARMGISDRQWKPLSEAGELII